VKATADAAKKKADAAKASADNAQAQMNAANLLPANTAYGKMPEQAAHKGYLRVQSGGPMEQEAFIKFPTSTIKATDAIIGATLRLFKLGGGGGPAVVKLASCGFSRNTLTYTNSKKLAESTASTGASAKFPEEKDLWVTIKLKGEVLQSARSNGDHLCFQVTGGPKSEPAIFSSELTANKPELKVEVKKPPPSEADKAKKAAEKEKEARAIQKEKQKEDKFAKKHEGLITAEVMKVKSDNLKRKIEDMKAKAKAKTEQATGGDAAKVVQAKASAQEAKNMELAITNKADAIRAEEKIKLEKAIVDAGLTGDARKNLKAKLEAEGTTRIEDRIAQMRKEVKAAAQSKQVAEVSKKLADINAEIETKLAAKIAALTTQSTGLSEDEKKEVKSKVDAAVAKDMASWKAGKIDGTEDATKKAAAAVAAGKDGAGDAVQAKMNKADAALKVQNQVDAKLDAKLDEAVAEKLATATAKAIEGIEAKLKTESETKLDSAITRETQGKNDADKASITLDLKNKAASKLRGDLAAATTGDALQALKSKLAVDLKQELKPKIEAKLKAEATSDEKLKADNKAKSAGNQLDLADSFHVKADDKIVELTDDLLSLT